MANKKTNESKAASRAGPDLDLESLRQLVEILEASEVTRFVWSNGAERLSIRRGAPAAPMAPPSMTSAPAVTVAMPVASDALPRASAPSRPTVPAAQEGKKGHIITSPFVGTFYRSSAPDQPAFVEVGAAVRKGQVVCIIEAMKLMNEIESDVAGKIAEVLAQNAQPVEFGQPLFRIEPA